MKKVDELKLKRSKKEQKEINKLGRVLVPMNTGTRSHEAKNKYNRKTSKTEVRRLVKGE